MVRVYRASRACVVIAAVKMPSSGDLCRSITSVTFEPTYDPFRSTEVADDEDEGLDDKFKQLANDVFGETDERREELVAELMEELQRSGFQVPDRRAFYIKILRAGNK